MTTDFVFPAMGSSMAARAKHLAAARSVVIKVGTAVLTDDAGRLDDARIAQLAVQIATLTRAGRAVTLVSSGAVGAGIRRLNLSARPGDLPSLQAAAAIGQPLLMRAWEAGFAAAAIPTAQVLVTRGDFADRAAYLNMSQTLRALTDFGAIAILNENDTTAVEELRFSDNDGLATLVAGLVGAHALVLLSSVPGLMAPLHGDPAAPRRVVEIVERVGPAVSALAEPHATRLGRGGMSSKLAAVARAAAAGTAVVIADGRQPGILQALFAPEVHGTLFPPTGERDRARRRWIAQAAHPVGQLAIDAGAVAALRAGASLLPSGVVGITGRFDRGDLVAVVEALSGTEIARGLTNYPSDETIRIAGLRSDRIAAALGSKPYDEIIHRDDLVLAEP